AVRGDRGSEEDLLERPGGAHLDAVAAGEGRVVRLAAPVVAAARRLLSAGERRTDHETVGAAGDRLDEVAGAAEAAVGDDVHVAATGLVHVVPTRCGDVRDRGGERDGDP